MGLDFLVVVFILMMIISIFIYLKVLNSKIEHNSNTDFIIKAFESFKENAGINNHITLRVNKSIDQYSGSCYTGNLIFLKNTLFLDKGLLNLEEKNKSSVLRVLGHELSHIKNKDVEFKNWVHMMLYVLFDIVAFLAGFFRINLYGLIYKNLAFHIIKELRSDIEGCHDIAKLSNKQIEKAFDFIIEKNIKSLKKT